MNIIGRDRERDQIDHIMSSKRSEFPALFAAAFALLISVLAGGVRACAAGDVKTVICIDPGHGGSDIGAQEEYGGRIVKEKNINLRIAKLLRQALLDYEDVEVIMTRNGDYQVSIRDRVDLAVNGRADVMISLHNNWPYDPDDRDVNGCMVIVPVSNYRPAGCTVDIYGIGNSLGENIVGELQALGIPLSRDFGVNKTGGLLRRPYNRKQGFAKRDVRYPDGSWADYYGLIRLGVEAGLPMVIVEHAYISDEGDFRTYLLKTSSLKALADADARGIAQTLGLESYSSKYRQ